MDAAMDAMKNAHLRCEQSGTQQELFQSLLQLSSCTATSVELVSAELANNSTQGGANWRRAMGESRSVQGLKVLGSDKSEFKNWNQKLLNIMTQCLGKEWRTYMLELDKMLDVRQKVLDNDDLELLPGYDDLTDTEQASESLYHVLVEKTEGEAALRVMSGAPGNGVTAYMKVYLWFAGTTGLALQEK